MKAWGCPFARLHQAGRAYINYTLEEMLYMKRPAEVLPSFNIYCRITAHDNTTCKE
jgi:hypothetical protein